MTVKSAMLGALFDVGPRRRPSGVLGAIVAVYGAAIALWVIYSATWAIIHPWALATVFLCAMFTLIFVLIGASPGADVARPGVLDGALALTSTGVGIYLAIHAGDIVVRIPQLDILPSGHVVAGSLLLVLALEAVRRTTGLGLTLIVLLFVAYNFLGHRLGGVIAHGYIGFIDFLEIMVFTTYGLPGLPVRVAASYAFMFVMFGMLLTRAGGGEFFFNLAAALSGRRVGGPAKVAVVSSGLYGMLSGSSVSDVVTTGSITIPMMRRLGYPGRLAGAVEVSASTGGSLMPPVMGAAVFVMVEYTGIPYREIAIAALIPALLYYASIYAQVHLRSLKMGLVGMAAADIPPLGATLRDGWPFLLPLVAITTALVLGYSPTYVAIFGALAVVVVAAPRSRTRLGPVRLFAALSETTTRMVAVSGAAAAAGMVIGGVTMTGLAQKVAHLIYALTGAAMLPTLLVAAAVTVVLGMGMPAVSAYILAAVLVGPILADLGLGAMAAHMFLLYYAVLSAITPPVAVAAYAAASIAEDNPLYIAGHAVRLSLAAFVVPFAFVYGQELLMTGNAFDIAVACASALVGVVLLAMALEGLCRTRLAGWQRALLALAALAFIVPSQVSLAVAAPVAVAVLALGGWRRPIGALGSSNKH